MKRLLMFLLPVAAMFASVISTGCEKDKGNDNEIVNDYSIVGTWKYEMSGLEMTIVLNKDTSGSIHLKTSDQDITENFSYKYIYIEGEEYLIIVGSSFEGEYYIVVTKDKLQIYDILSEDVATIFSRQ